MIHNPWYATAIIMTNVVYVTNGPLLQNAANQKKKKEKEEHTRLVKLSNFQFVLENCLGIAYFVLRLGLKRNKIWYHEDVYKVFIREIQFSLDNIVQRVFTATYNTTEA